MKENVRLSEKVQLDASYCKINLKGTRPDNMPRYSKRRGNVSQFSGISHHKICVAAAIDENDNCVMRVTGLGSESVEKYASLTRQMRQVTTIVSDSKTSIRMFSNSIGADDKGKIITTSWECGQKVGLK